MNRPLSFALAAFVGISAVGACQRVHAAEIRGFANKCLDVRGGSTDNGTVARMWDCAGVTNQQ